MEQDFGQSEQDFGFLETTDFDAIERENEEKIDNQEVIEDDGSECESCKI